MKLLLLSLAMLFSTVCLGQAPTNGLVGYWPMDGNYNDSTGSGLNATNYSCTPTQDAFGTSDRAMNLTNTTFDAQVVNQYGFLPMNSALNFGESQDFTIDFNVYFTPFNFRNGGGIFDYGLNDHWGYGVTAFDTHAGGGNLRIFLYYGTKFFSTTNFALNYNSWYHITITKSGPTAKIYINGILNSEDSTFGNSSINYSSVTGAYFGAIHYAAYNPPQYAGLNGKIDEFRIYNRVLTETEIQDIVSVSLGVEEHLAENKTAFYPNPAEDKITFATDIQSVEIFDTCGKRIDVMLEHNQIDISQLSSGLYFVKYLTTENLFSTGKLIKK